MLKIHLKQSINYKLTNGKCSLKAFYDLEAFIEYFNNIIFIKILKITIQIKNAKNDRF